MVLINWLYFYSFLDEFEALERVNLPFHVDVPVLFFSCLLSGDLHDVVNVVSLSH